MEYPEIIKDIFRFNDQIKKFKNFNSISYRLLLYRFFFHWRFLKDESDSLKFQIPWITFPAISKLKKLLNRKMTVFEYGSGGSTLFFADRVETLVSIEHDKKWFEKLSSLLKEKNIKNVNLSLIEPFEDKVAKAEYYSENENYKGFSFEKYVKEISKYPDYYFDLIIIDGRARTGCFSISLNKVKNGGTILWDNTERDRYRSFTNFHHKNFERLELPGPTPFTKSFTVTTLFKKISQS